MKTGILGFYPPKVEYKKPKAATFLAFLQSKGWSLEKKWGGYFLMKPPVEVKVENDPDFVFYLPCAEKSTTYDELAHLAVETFADLYDIKLQDLFDLLSQSLEDIQKEVERQPRQLKMKKAMLANAS